jgi:hypothetical protein
VAATRRGRWDRAEHVAGPAGHGVRGARRAAGDHRPVHVDPVGLALTILVGQLPKLFGFSTDANGLINESKAFVDGLSSGDAVAASLAIGLLSRR